MNQTKTTTEKPVSVIIPVYNAEKWLNRCIDSVLAQDYKNTEIILIDDGSSDQSGRICDEYAEKHSNICVVHQDNAGPSAARNSGIRIAKGDYIEFLDSDDYIDSDFISTLVSRIEQDHSDIAICGYRQFEKEVGKSDIVVRPENETKNINDFFFVYKKWGYSIIPGSPANRIYKAEIIKNNNLFFNEDLSYAEDHIFNMDYYRFSDTVSSLDYAGYNICTENQNSASRNSSIDFFKIKSIHKTLSVKLKELLEFKKVVGSNNIISCIKAGCEFSYSLKAVFQYSCKEFRQWYINERKNLDALAAVRENTSCNEWSKRYNIAYAFFRWCFINKLSIVLYFIFKFIN